MSPLHLLSFLLTSLTLISSITGDTTPTVYEVLQEYDFPIGMLPVGITNYELDRSTGKFKVYLEKSCEFYVQDYKLRYKSTISGTISNRKLKNLSGISVKILILWLNIGEVSREGDDLEFSVGVLSAGFYIDNFVESPQCGCGFDCNSGGVKSGEGYLNRFLYSS
ncbi:Epoxide hydrolase family protein [Heracleum sosnowskyi]|uniref:Epoxide hydrolase family protein n=1 Tax=Heracleum sosnowskyi TaxID=360622 RepID=A0AAD8IGK9_9APIA|nr:Epoxide hydrolase family protein [Heracleum sosnowskyi]